MTSPTPAWTVTSQAQVTEQDQTGNYVSGWRIYFTMTSGTTGSVFIPQTIYTADNVKAAIQTQVAEMMNVEGLTG